MLTATEAARTVDAQCRNSMIDFLSNPGARELTRLPSLHPDLLAAEMEIQVKIQIDSQIQLRRVIS